MPEEMTTIKAMFSGGSSGPETYVQAATKPGAKSTTPVDIKSKMLKRNKRRGARMINTNLYQRLRELMRKLKRILLKRNHKTMSRGYLKIR
jgi:hypothetical protein